MTELHGRNGRRGGHGKDRKGSQDHEPVAAKSERFRRLLADLMARQIMDQPRERSGGGKS